MRFLAVDDDGPALLRLEKELKKACPDGRIYEFSSEKEAREFLDAPGIRKEKNHLYATDARGQKDDSDVAMVRASGEPYGTRAVQECDDSAKRNIYIRTFGNFEMFLNDRPVRFNRSKAKELLAYLVDRRGSGVTTPEAYSVLWEDCDYTPSSKDKVQHAKKDLRDTLGAYGIGDILMSSRNWLAIDAHKVNCDYYEYLEGDPRAAGYYNGEYMSQYSWAEHTIGMLEGRLKR